MDYNEIQDTLPEGWIWTTLDSISANITDGSHNPPSKQNQGIPMLSARNIENGKITFDEVRFISEDEFKYENQRTRIEAGDVLLTIVATIGRSAIVPNPVKQEFALQRSVAAIKPLINGHYLMYLFQGPVFQKLLIDNAKGTAQKGVYLKTLRELPIPLPPLEEQHRIVARIEELFSELDHAEESLKKAQKQLEVYKQALLKSAFEGKLTEKWRGEKDLLKNKNWIKATIGDYSMFIGSGSTPKGGRNVYSNQGIPFIRSLNIHTNYFSKVDLAYISEAMHENMARTHTQPNDVLLTITGASIGRCAYIPESLKTGNVNQHVCIIRVKTEDVLYKYLTFYLNSPEAQILINRINSGATREALTLSQIKDFIFPLCPLIEQDQIVQELESKFTLIENLENSILLSYQRIKTFRQTILKKAFEGKLIPHFLHNETAKELLKRIRIEKENYLLEQKTVEKQKPRKVMSMETNKSILEVLQEINHPISAKELWLRSKHKDNIEDFYSELKEIYSLIREVKEDTQSLISLKA